MNKDLSTQSSLRRARQKLFGLAAAALATISLASVVKAQDIDAPPTAGGANSFNYQDLPILSANPDLNGVDVGSGSFNYTSPFAIVAPGAGHLNGVTMSFNGRRHSFSLNIHMNDNTYTLSNGNPEIRHLQINLGGASKLFTCNEKKERLASLSPIECSQNVHLDGSRLARKFNHYVFTDKETGYTNNF